MLSTDVSHCSTSRSVLQYSPWRTAVLQYPYYQYVLLFAFESTGSRSYCFCILMLLYHFCELMGGGLGSNGL